MNDHRINPNGVVIALAVLLSVLILLGAGHWLIALGVIAGYVLVYLVGISGPR